MPTLGRGGAGNIQTLADATARFAADLESNQTATDSPSSSDPTPLPPREEQLYAHTGRGGSGNYYSPRELRENGQFHGAESSHILGDGTPAPPGAAGGEVPVLSAAAQQPQRSSVPVPQQQQAAATAPVRTYGRGGAGNFAFGVTESAERAAKRREEEEGAARMRVQAEVERGVSESLALPAKAKLAGT